MKTKTKDNMKWVIIGIVVIVVGLFIFNDQANTRITPETKFWIIDTTQCINMVYDPLRPCVTTKACAFVEAKIAKWFPEQFKTEAECQYALTHETKPIYPIMTQEYCQSNGGFWDGTFCWSGGILGYTCPPGYTAKPVYPDIQDMLFQCYRSS